MYTTTKCDKTQVTSTHVKQSKYYTTVYSQENISRISKKK